MSTFRQLVAVVAPGGDRVPTRVLTEAATHATQVGTYPLTGGFTLLTASGRNGVLVSDAIRSFREVMDLPIVAAGLASLPAGRVAPASKLTPAVQRFLRKALADRLPYNAVPQEGDFGKLYYALRPVNRLVLQSGGTTVNLDLGDFELIGMDRADRRTLFAPMDKSAIPLAKSPDQIADEIDLEARSPKFKGEGMEFQILRKPSSEKTTDAVTGDALTAYRKALDAAREAAAEAMKPLQRELLRRYPELGNQFPKGSAFSDLPPDKQESLRSSVKALGGSINPGPADLEGFLSSARIADTTIGLTIGFAFEPSKSVFGITIWPR